MAHRPQVRFLRLTEGERKTFMNVLCKEAHGKESPSEEMLFVVLNGAIVFTEFDMRVPLGVGAEFDAVIVPPGQPPRLEQFHGPPGLVRWDHICGIRNIAAVLTQTTVDSFNGGTNGHRSPAVTPAT